MTRRVEDWARWLANQISDHERRLSGVETKPQLAYSSIEDGSLDENDAEGNLVGVIGKQFDGTHTITSLNGPTPPTPTEADAAAIPGLIGIRWNGLFFGGLLSPMDLKHVAAYVVPTGGVLDYTAQSGVMTGELGDVLQVQARAGTYDVYLVAWTLSGRKSLPSQSVTVTVPEMVDLGAAMDDFNEAMDNLTTALAENDVALAEAVSRTPTTSAEEPTPTDGEGKEVNATWRQVSGAGKQVGFWRWDGTVWAPMPLDTTVIPVIDIGTGTAGDMAIDRLVVTGDAHFKTAVMDTAFADMFATRKLMANQVVIGPGADLIPDPAFVSPEMMDARNAFSTMVVSKNPATGDLDLVLPDTGNYYFRPTGVEQSTAAYKEWIAVTPGEAFSFKATVTTQGTGNLYITGRTQDGQSFAFPAERGPDFVPGTGTYVYEFTTPTDCYWILPQMKFTGWSGTAQIKQGSLTMKRKLDGTLIVDGLMNGKRIVGARIETDAEPMTGIKLTGNQLVAYKDTTGEESFRVDGENALMRNSDSDGNTSEVSSQGMRVFQTDPNGETREHIRLGTFGADDYFGLTDEANELSVSIDREGGITGRTFSVADALTYQGTELSDMLAQIPKGIVGHASSSHSAAFSGQHGWIQAYLRTGFDAVAGRMYRLKASNIYGVIGGARYPTTMMRYSLHYNDATPAAHAATAIVAQVVSPSATTGGSTNVQASTSVEGLVFPAVSGPTSVMLSFNVAEDVPTGDTTGRIYSQNGQPLWLTVEDMGPAIPQSGVEMSGQSGATGPASIPYNPPPTATTQTKDFFATGTRSYVGNDSTYNYNTSKMYSGLSPSGYGDLSSVAVFQSFTSMLSGAAIHDIWVYVYYDFWYYGSGGQAWISVHGAGSLPATRPGRTYAASKGSWSRGSGKWIRLGDGLYAGFKSGQYKGFMLGQGGGGFIQYGYAHDARMRFRFTK